MRLEAEEFRLLGFGGLRGFELIFLAAWQQLTSFNTYAFVVKICLIYPSIYHAFFQPITPLTPCTHSVEYVIDFLGSSPPPPLLHLSSLASPGPPQTFDLAKYLIVIDEVTL